MICKDNHDVEAVTGVRIFFLGNNQVSFRVLFISLVHVTQYELNNHDDHLGCASPLSTEPGTGVADEGGELLVEGQAGDQGQHLKVRIICASSQHDQ